MPSPVPPSPPLRSAAPPRLVERLRCWAPGIVLLAMTLAVYLPCLRGPLLWDDLDWLAHGEWNLRNAAGLWRIWTVPGSIQQYYPLTATTFWLDYQIWGKDTTLPHHLENVLLHGGGAVLFWLLLARLRVRGAWLAAAVYAAHPVMAESVAWITERKNVLCSFFSLAALLAHGAGAGWWPSRWRSRPAAVILAVLLFLLALLAKISAAVLPAAVLVIGWWQSGRVRWKADGLRVLPWLAAVAMLAPITHHLEQEQVLYGDPIGELTWAERWLLAGQLPWFYLGKLLWPRHLCVLYEPWTLQPGLWWHWAGWAGLPLLTGVLLWRRRRGALALLMLFGGTLFPVLGFFEVNGMKYAWAADRWVYLPALAFCAGTGVALARLPGRWPRAVAVALILALLSGACWRQAALYGDMDRFWQAAIAGNSRPWKARNDYGSQLLDAGRPQEALEQFQEATRLFPGYASAFVNLANAQEALGRSGEALSSIEQALALQPENNAAMQYNKAVILDRLGRPEPAEAALREAIRQKPDFFAAHNDLGNKLLLSGRLDEASACFQTLLKLRPGNAKVLTSIGNIHFLRGETGPALASFDAALRDDPELVSALANSAWILATTPEERWRDSAKALAQAEKAVRLSDRQDPGMLQILAAAHADGGDFDQAAEVAREAALLADRQGKAALAQSLRAMAGQFARKQPYRLTPP